MFLSRLGLFALGSTLVLPGMAFAASSPDSPLTLSSGIPSGVAITSSRANSIQPVYLADTTTAPTDAPAPPPAAAPAPAPEAPNIHGFLELPFKTAYITPRGLVVQNKGLVFQPVGGLVFPLGDFGVFKNLTFVTGVWNSVNTANEDPRVGAWDEMDYFGSFSSDVTKEINLNLTYGAWNFPASTLNKPDTEHNIDLKVSYDDTKLLGGWALHPYVDFFWEVGGSSTVVLGRNGGTGYAEIGISPSYTFKASDSCPITFAAPIYFSVGPEDYWGHGTGAAAPDGNIGVFSAGITATMPLNFIPARYGHWHADADILYYDLINNALRNAGTILSGNTDRDVINVGVGVGVNF